MQIQFERIVPEAKVPARATNQAVGYDCFALGVHRSQGVIPLPYQIEPGEMVKIGTGIKMALPPQIQCEIRPRSGLVQNHRLNVANSPGTLDPDYRGELCVLLVNQGNEPFVVKEGMRIAQLIFSQTEQPVFEEVSKLPNSIRNEGGFGSTGNDANIKEGTAAYDLKIRRLDIFFMRIANEVSRLSNCIRGCTRNSAGHFERDANGYFIGQTRRFGCVIVKDNNVVSMGYNSQARGQEFCSEAGCLRDAEKIPSGTKIERCRAIHAEQMALTQMNKSGVGCSTKGATIYVTAEPCEICAKEIAESGISDLVVLADTYPKNGITIIKTAGINVRLVIKSEL